jgi:hypothetical protein
MTASEVLVPPHDHPDVIVGLGPAAKELLTELGPLDLERLCALLATPPAVP